MQRIDAGRWWEDTQGGEWETDSKSSWRENITKSQSGKNKLKKRNTAQVKLARACVCLLFRHRLWWQRARSPLSLLVVRLFLPPPTPWHSASSSVGINTHILNLNTNFIFNNFSPSSINNLKMKEQSSTWDNKESKVMAIFYCPSGNLSPEELPINY